MSFLESRYGKIAVPDEKDLITKSLEYYGEWAENELNILSKLIPKSGVVLDVGSYIGTHLLAFSTFVGFSGKVYGFEPQKNAFELIAKTIVENNISNVEVNNFALGEEDKLVDFTTSDVDEDNRGSFSLLTSKTITNSSVETAITVRKLDLCNIPACDFIKIDAEGMESNVLYGAIAKIKNEKPIIFCECNTVENGKRILTWAQENNYEVISVLVPAFNPNNFKQCDDNFLNGSSEVSLILFPIFKKHIIEVAVADHKHRRVVNQEDIFLTLLAKKQYVESPEYPLINNFSPSNFNIFDNDINLSEFAINDEVRPEGLLLVVPFYKSPHLTTRLYQSLQIINDELIAANVRVIFYNDSPDCQELADVLKEIEIGHNGFELEIITNNENLGFIGTMNKAMDYALSSNRDLILLNSDTVMFKHVIKELAEVAYSDPMIGFVSPRSNNATICTFPHNADTLDLSPTDALNLFDSMSIFLPRISYVPTSVGFCMYIKHKIIAEVGKFDLIYGKGYNEENDLICRANRFGYRAVLANKAFVWHEGEQSFNTLENKRNLREEENAKTLASRYPEYPRLVHDYYTSVDYRSESLFSGLVKNEAGMIDIGFDFTSLGTYHNGTFEAGKQLILAADKIWPDQINIIVICAKASWEFHELNSKNFQRVFWRDPVDFSTKMSAIVKIGQPFSSDGLAQLIYRAPTIAYFMLDTIASDCGYLKLDFDENIWRFALKWSDIIFTNSVYSASQFARRYRLGKQTLLFPSLHSISLEQYKGYNLKVSTIKKNIDDKKILIIGNKFAHKGLDKCVNALSEKFPDISFRVLGGPKYNKPNINSIDTGNLTDSQMNDLYDCADVIIFPSHYEGFGFPLLHSLARGKPIFIRDIPAFTEIARKLKSGRDNIHIFQSIDDLVATLNRGIPSWVGSDAIGEQDGWERSALEVYNALTMKMKRLDLSHVTERMRWFELAYCNGIAESQGSASVAQNIAARVSHFIERKIIILLKIKPIYIVFRTVWRSFRFLKK